MIALNTLLFGLVSGLIGLKVALLAAAAVLFVQALAARAGQPKLAPARLRRPRLDVRA